VNGISDHDSDFTVKLQRRRKLSPEQVADMVTRYQAHTPEKDAPQIEWSVRAENGVACYASEDIARAVAAGDHGYTLGADRSPLVEAFSRVVGTDEWTRVLPPGSGNEAGEGGAYA